MSKRRKKKIVRKKTWFADNKGKISSTAYDDAFKTMVNDCSRLVLPLLNETFGTDYDDTYTIRFAKDEHHIRLPDGMDRKITGDEHFYVVDKTGTEAAQYIYECQSTSDRSMSVRMFEYAAAVGIEGRKIINGKLHIVFPSAGVLYLRGRGGTREENSEIYIDLPDGTSLSYNVKNLMFQQYNVDELFKRKLYLLIPFSLFLYERELPRYEYDRNELKTLTSEFERIVKNLDDLVEAGEISEFEKSAIIEMSQHVVDALTTKYPHVRKGVETYMGGKVLDYEAKRILMKGIAEGEAKGVTRGRAEGKAEGRAEGKAEGKAETQSRMVQLIGILTDNNDIVTLKNISKDPALLEELYKKYNI